MKNTLKLLAASGLAATLALGGTTLLAQAAPSQNTKTTPGESADASGTPSSQGNQTSKDNVSTVDAKQTAERNESTVPVVQSQAPADQKVTDDIRNALKSDKDLSYKARHARVVTTADGEVYLWGKVKSQEEENRVIDIAKPYVGNRVLKSKLQQPLGDKPTMAK